MRKLYEHDRFRAAVLGDEEQGKQEKFLNLTLTHSAERKSYIM